MNLSTQTSETSRSASKPLELQVHIQEDPVWHKSFYFRTRRIATVSQQGPGSLLSVIHRWPQSQGEEERYQESWRAYLRTFHCDSAYSTYLPEKVPFTIPAQVTQTVNGRRQCGHIAQQVRAIDYATLSYTQTEKPVSIQNRNEEKKKSHFS